MLRSGRGTSCRGLGMDDLEELDEDVDEPSEDWCVAAPMENPTIVTRQRQYLLTAWTPVVYVQDRRGTRQTDRGWWA